MDKRTEDIFIKYLEKSKYFSGFGAGGRGQDLNTAKPAATTPPAGTTPNPAQNTPNPAATPPAATQQATGRFGAPKASAGKKLNFGVKQGAKKAGGFASKVEGGILGALGAAGKGAKEELSRFRAEKAGSGGGQTLQPQQSAEDQEQFQQNVSRTSGGGQTARLRRQNQRMFQTRKSFNPALASLLAVSAGFAASDAVVNASGARGARSITDDQLRLFETMANKKRGRKLRKEHSPLPPIQGLVWDEGAKRWRKPENVGKTASEVQGKKRIRGSGLGETARSAGGAGSGKGRGRGFSTGRAARVATGDIGVAGAGATAAKASKRRRRRRK